MIGADVGGSANGSRWVGAAGVVLGTALVTNGHRMFSWVEQRRPDRTEQDALTVLGLRHIVQGTAQLTFPRLFSNAYIAVDVLHAISMAIMAARNPRRRASTLISAIVAGVFALLTTGSRLHRTVTGPGDTDPLN